MCRCLVLVYMSLFYSLTCFALSNVYSWLYTSDIFQEFIYLVSCSVITCSSEMCSDYHYDLIYSDMYSVVSSLAILICKICLFQYIFIVYTYLCISQSVGDDLFQSDVHSLPSFQHLFSDSCIIVVLYSLY